ncbi:hypothetical protein BSL78_11545 [Apostichopus japonicus]|uniref:Ig-like domain-containing protein n=1 Tax=Stichopus japonicus TaxID=307972 RepID=A0A2G8KU94_STIJA|nr:hypothetical protein BSL78_11545 [Apostichopus japonicus]
MPQIHRVILDDSVTLQCPWSSEGNKQWYFNDSQLYFNKLCLDRRCDDSILLREDYSLYIRSVEIQLEGEYQCKQASRLIMRHKLIVEGQDGFLKIQCLVGTSHEWYELPILTLFVNGDVVSSKTAAEVPYKGSGKATCIAIGARPSPNLTWIIDKEGVISSQTVRLSQDTVSWDSTTQSFNVTSTVQFSPRTKNGSIVCHALTYFNDTVDKFISYVTKGRTIVTDNRSKVDMKSAGITEQTVPVILVPITVICTAIIIMCILWAAKHAHCCHPQIPQVTLPCEMSEESVREQPVLTSVKTSSIRPTSQRLSLELPQLPHYNSNESRRVTKPEAEHGIYSMIDESFPEFRVYREEDLCKVVTLNIGKSYTRWMGMIKESLGTKCVIITTASETAITTNDVHWDLFAKRALELPMSDYITKLEGICISSGQLHLLHENLACGTLAAHMTARKPEGSI